MQLHARQKKQLFTLFTQGPLSRTELVEKLGIRRNTVYDDMTELLTHGIIQEQAPNPKSVGRPRTPLQIDTQTRHVIGLSLQPQALEIGRFDLYGKPVTRPLKCRTSTRSLMDKAQQMLEELINEQTLGIGVSIPGFIDREKKQSVLSQAFKKQHAVSLANLYRAAGDVTISIEPEAYAIAARWLLNAKCPPEEDTLLIFFEDGSMGSSFIVNGIPNRGCISGANELGHMRMNVPTQTCYCGGTGCLERICDSVDLKAHGLPIKLAQALADDMLDHPAMTRMIDLLAMGIANVINFTRASHVIMASHLPHSQNLIHQTINQTKRYLLKQLIQRIEFDLWPEAGTRSACNAAHLALADLYFQPIASDP